MTDMQILKVNQQKAFTLLEVMAAIALISIVLTSVYKMHFQTIRMSEMTRFYTLAPMLARTKMAEFDIKPQKDQDSGSGDFGYEYPGYRWEIAVEETKVAVSSNIDKKKSGSKDSKKSEPDKSDKSKTTKESATKKTGTAKVSEFDKKILMKKIDVTVSLNNESRYSFRTYRLMTEEDGKK